MNNTHTEFERYYQQVRLRQKRDTFSWSLLLLALYFAAGSMAEFNLFTIWHSLPNFLDYMFETLPTLRVADLFADSHTKGSLAYWGYRLPIQLPLIWETLQLALASTLVAVAIATLPFSNLEIPPQPPQIQHSLEQGNVLYPDVVIHLPGERNIIVDSKVSLVAYDRYVSATSQQVQQQALQEHIMSIKKHVDELAAKQYDSFQGSLDFVMMFVPVEPAYLIAIQNDPGMWSYAYHKRIVLISPTNLIACLKLMSDLWSREMQNKNAMQIARRGELMLKKFENFIETLSALGGTIAKSQEAYDKAMGQLRDGQGNLIGQASKLRELGIKAFKDLPEMIAED